MTSLLIADDDTEVRDVLAQVFTRRGYTVLTADDGASALETAARYRPDVILTDLDMPGMDGLALCAAIRADPALCLIPMALLSGSVRYDDERLRGSALCEVLRKPARNADLVATVQRLAVRGSHDHDAAAHCRPAA